MKSCGGEPAYFPQKLLVDAILTNHLPEAQLILANWYYGKEPFDPKQFYHALPLAVALGQDSLIDVILTQFGGSVTPQIIEKALESAAATNNLGVFQRMYHIARHRLTPEGFSHVLENALYWAALLRHEEIVSFILERAFAYNEVPNLNLNRVGQHVTQMLAHNLPQPEREVLTRIRQNLADVLLMREAVGARSLGSTALQSLAHLIPHQLLPEIIALILGLALRPPCG